MSKAVLISIRPEWCKKIASGRKTIEVRKSRPKIEMPFKVYIYETKQFHKNTPYSFKTWNRRGKVIGEFICDDIIVDLKGENADVFEKQGSISLAEQKKYGGNKSLYGWNISELVIYDKPKKLSEFRKHGFRTGYKIVNDNKRGVVSVPFTCENAPLQRPPQSWCYVEEL